MVFRSLGKVIWVGLHWGQQYEGWNCFGDWKRFLGRIGRALRGGIGGKRIWDPGGKEEEFQSMTWRCEKKERRAGSME
jgi:hypothetical protein